ncbi:MAG: hypothetical protein VXX89_04720 [Pseudomonadota bacterium]|nr:hypothetical protein [Pseudomonadota bacterium]
MNIDFVRFLSIRLVVLVCLTGVTACAALPVDLFGQGADDIEVTEVPTPQTVSCEAPRPKICTLQYEPVCALMESGSVNTYPSACNACADIAVSAWRPKPCEE